MGVAKSGLLSYYFHSDYLVTVIHESSDGLNKLIKKSYCIAPVE
jgi:hypothetical protein